MTPTEIRARLEALQLRNAIPPLYTPKEDLAWLIRTLEDSLSRLEIAREALLFYNNGRGDYDFVAPMDTGERASQAIKKISEVGET